MHLPVSAAGATRGIWQDENHDHAEVDVDQDGDLDLIVSHGSGVAVLLAVSEGDFDRDGTPTAEDLQLLRDATRTGNFDPRFDISRDGHLDELDTAAWVENVARTRMGDTNLDGDVDFADFVSLSRNYGASDQPWRAGDFDGDLTVGESDFEILRSNYGFRRESV